MNFKFQFVDWRTKFFFLCLAAALGVFVGFLSDTKAKGHEVFVHQVVTQDPRFTLDPLNIDRQWGLAAANFPAAWEKTLGSASTVVAIIDTGIDQTHEDLNQVKFTEGFDFVKNQTILTNTNSDDNGHGTLIASVIAATPNNNKGVAGTNWYTTLMPIKALDSSGRGDTASVAKAIMWAVDHHAQIVNLSLGGSGFEQDADLAKAVAYAFNQGVLVVASAGNDVADTAKDIDQNPVFPVCNDNNQNMVLGVTAIDQHRVKPDFANYGKNCIDVVAPGRRILGAINIDPVSKSVTQNGYAYVSGTSLAAAFVSGQAALIKSLYPYASNRQIRDKIITTASSVDSLNLAQCGGQSCQGRLGAGLIDARKSLEVIFKDLNILEGDVVRAEGESEMYLILGGQRRLISPMVFDQIYINSYVKIFPEANLQKIPKGPYATPLEGTLVKSLKSPTVYYISSGLKLPISEQIFKQRGFKYSDIKIAESAEIDSWVTGKFLAPKEGTLVKTPVSKALYWTVSGVLHAINDEFYKHRGLKVFPIITVTAKDFVSYNIGEAYIR